MKLGTQVDLGPGHIMSDGNPAPPPSIFGLYLLWPNGWMDKDTTWCEVGLGPGDFVRWGPSSSSPKRGRSPQFLAHVYCGQTAGWIKMALGTEVGLGPDHIVLDGDPAPLP